MRFLSHSQMLNVFQRASIRAGLNLQYSQGFNPRPKISLPLPRPVGIESDDELLVLSVHSDLSYCSDENSLDNFNSINKLNELARQLPNGCDVISIDTILKKPSFQPDYAKYEFTVRPEHFNKNLINRINNLLCSESLIVERPIDIKGRSRKGLQPLGEALNRNKIKKIDMRDFIISIIIKQNIIIIECKITPTGSIRILEMMELLELDTEKLACPIKRTNVKWREENN